MDEQIVLVAEDGTVIGKAPKLASHHADTPLHKGFSCYVFNTHGQFLLTQRALTKKVWPSVWTNSVCGHPAPNESGDAAVKRRLEYELGITQITGLECIAPLYRYKTPEYNGIIENEICPVFVAITAESPSPNPDEVADFRWIDWQDVSNLIETEADTLSYWFKDQYCTVFDHNAQFETFLENLNG